MLTFCCPCMRFAEGNVLETEQIYWGVLLFVLVIVCVLRGKCMKTEHSCFKEWGAVDGHRFWLT